MKHNSKKRLLSLLLVLVLLVSYMPVTTGAVESGTDIKAIEKPTGIVIVEDYDDYIGENWVAELGLPRTVKITLANGTKTDALVNWDTSVIDTRTTGYYAVPGEVTLPIGATNGKNLKVSITVQVRDTVNIISNGDFNNGANGWKGWTLAAAKDPLNADNNVLFAKKSAMVTSSGGHQIIFQRDADTINKLVKAFETLGAGQYYFAVDAMSAPYDESTPAHEDTQLWMDLRYNTNGTNSNSMVVGSTPKVKLSSTEWTTTSAIWNLQDGWNWLRSDVKCRADTATAGAVYLDSLQLVLLKQPLKVEPSGIVSVKTELVPHNVVVNYPDYVGANWQDELGLPKKVEVLTDNGGVTELEVEWDYSVIDFTKTGKYVVTGSFKDKGFPNPNGVTLQQLVYVSQKKNLIPNGSFESGIGGWYIRGLNPSPSSVKNPVVDGKFAAMTGKLSTERTQESVLDTRNITDQIGAAVALQGAGQYYYSGWMQSASETLIEGMTTQAWLLYKTMGADGVLSASTIVKDEKRPLDNKQYTKTGGIVEFPDNTAWVRLDMYVQAKTAEDLMKAQLYVDNLELIPLNVLVEQHEGAMEEVETIIPARQIIQNYQDYVGGTVTIKDLMLPETVQVRSTTGEVVTIPVNWEISKLDLTKTGTYKIPGILEDISLANPNGLTVEQTIRVVAYENLLVNGSFEDYGDNWRLATHVSAELGINNPVKDGSLSIMMKVGRLQDYTNKWIQSMWLEDINPLGLRVTASGAGRYYYGGWVHGTQSSADMQFYTRFWYRYYEHGDTSVHSTAPTVNISANGWTTSGSIVDLPGDIYWSRLDLYVAGTVDAMKNSELYIDDMELVPLNVEIPNMNDIMQCETVADTYAHKGSSLKELDLPEKLQVILKSGQKFMIPVKWDTTNYDPNHIGEQTLTGTLELGGRFKNSKNFVPSTVVTLRAKGEELRQTIYIANDGSEDNDGLSPENPKKEITKIPTYLAQGYNVKLKKGDVWYIETGSLTFKALYGTAKAPLTITSYGEGAKPIIGFMRLIADSEWKLVDEKRNVYAADVTSFGIKQGESVHRCFVKDEAYFHLSRSNYVTLEEKEFCSYNKTIYIRMPAGEKPEHVEITPFGTGGIRMNIQDVSYLTFEDIHIKGASSIFPVVRMDAPTKFVKFTKCDFTHVWYYTILLEAEDERVHYKPEFSYLYIDTFISEKQGAESGYYNQYWNPHGNEGITMRDGVDGAWIHHNHIRQVSHAFIAIESLDKAKDYTTTGCYNCVIEDNVMEAGNALYARPFNICGGRNLSGIQMCHDNTYRRNKAYDMTVSSHLYGEHNVIYSNLISYSHTTYNEDGTLFDGKSAQPWGFDTIPWSDHGSVGNMVINNSFYDVAGAVAVWDQANTVHDNIYANNLVVNWKSDSGSTKQITGAFYDNTVGFNYYMNNALYDIEGDLDHFVVNDMMYSAHDVNNTISGYEGNLYGDPLFENVDMMLLGKGVRQDFTLSSESPYRYAGLSFYDPVFKNFPAWERLIEDPTDINGVVFLAESPSIGAWSFCERIGGDVAEVGELESVLCRPGATIDQLQLPDSVPAVNDEGIDVVLLVEWDESTFDGSKPGTITLTGSLRNGPHTELNVSGKTASIDINIKDKLELMSIVTRVDALSVLFQTSYEDVLAKLPTSLHVVEESGFEEDLPVTWTCSNYKPNVPGDYTFKCVLPTDMITNAREFPMEVSVRLMHELGRGVELLINPNFNEGTSAGPWKLGWLSGYPGTFRITEDPELLPEGSPAAAIVTVGRKYASIQQEVTGQVQLLGDGQYLMTVKMRAFDITQPIDSSYACLQLLGPITVVHRTRPKSNIGTEYVEFSKIMNLQDVMDAQSINFHTSTGKSRYDAEDGPRSYVIAGCSFVYLGKNDAEAEATLDSIDLNWNAIRGENGFDYQVTSKLNLPTQIGKGSTIKWTSSDESAITPDGVIRMGYNPKTVTLTATITYKGIETVKKYTVSVPRNPDLHTFTGSLTGDQTADIGDELNVILSTASATATSYNAYRFTLSFNATKLEYVGISDPAATVEINGGQLIISGIGTDKPITDTLTITFKALKSGITEIKLVKVEMDSNPEATLDELPPMTIKSDSALIDVLKEVQTDTGDDTNVSANDDPAMIWIIVAAAVVLITGAVVAVILIKKKKQKPTE